MPTTASSSSPRRSASRWWRSLILQNAVDVTEALRSLVREGYPVKRKDVAMLSPYLTSHAKRFGDYVVDLDATPGPLDGRMPELVE